MVHDAFPSFPPNKKKKKKKKKNRLDISDSLQITDFGMADLLSPSHTSLIAESREEDQARGKCNSIMLSQKVKVT